VRIPLTQSTVPAPAATAASPATPLGNLQPGAVIAARVVALLDSGQVQLAIGNALIEAAAQVPLTLGSTVQLAVQNTENGITLQFLGEVAATSTPVAPSTSGNVAAAPAAGDAAASVAAAPSVNSAAASGIGPAASIATVAAPTLAPPDAAVALTEAVRSAAVTQNSLAPLFAEITAAVNLTSLPEPVQRAALRVLSLRPQLDENLDGGAVKQAFDNSGLFLEAQLAEEGSQGAAPSDAATNAATDSATNSATNSLENSAPDATAATVAGATTPPMADLKAALTVFRDVVAMLLAPEEDMPSSAPASAVAAGTGASAAAADGQKSAPALPALPSAPLAPPPPFRGAPTSAQPPAAPSIDAATPPQQAARILMTATDAALSRQTLLQAASLPVQPVGPTGVRTEDGGPRWNFEVPFATPQGTNVAQFEISRDGRSARPVDGVAPVWRARFSIDIDPIGPVHAQVSLRGTRTAVTLWAESADGAARLRAGAASLADALRAAELDAGDLVVRDGMPRVPGGAAAAAGHFLDRAS
jgi:hypothetical protein